MHHVYLLEGEASPTRVVCFAVRDGSRSDCRVGDRIGMVAAAIFALTSIAIYAILALPPG